MTIGSSVSSAAAGIQADLKTFAAFGVYGTSVVTAVTAGNTREIAAIAEVPEEVVIAQIDTVMEDIGADAIKTGMLSARSTVECVVDRLDAWGAPKLVVDPVMTSRSGAPLLKPEALATLKRELLPMALIVTPTAQEAEVLSGHAITSIDDARETARAIHALGPSNVVIKGTPGGALPGILVFDGHAFAELGNEPIDLSTMLGAGSVFSAAIAAQLARDLAPLPAIEQAKRFVERAVSASYPVGDRRKPVNPLFALEPIGSSAAAAPSAPRGGGLREISVQELARKR